MLARVIARVGPCTLKPEQDETFAALAESIVYQQLNGKAAATIHARVLKALGGRATPERLLKAPAESLRAAGLSANKYAAMKDLAEKCVSGEVPRRRQLEALDDAQIIERLVTVRGIGVWTAQMFLMFRLARPDVLPRSMALARALLAAATLFGATAAHAGPWGWGLRGNTLNTEDGLRDYFGSPLGAFEAFGRYNKPDSRLGGEFSLGGYGATRSERGSGNFTTPQGVVPTTYEWEQSIFVMPLLLSLDYGPRSDKGSLRVGGGLGIYLVSLRQALTFGNGSAQGALGLEDNPTTVTTGPHLQASGDWFFSKHVGVGFLARYAFARWNQRVYKDLVSATSAGAGFRDSRKLGNIAGFTVGAGLAVRL